MRFLKERLIFWGFFLGLIVVDQAVKAWVRATLVEGASIAKPLPGIFEIRLTYNRGIAFGLFQGHGVGLAPVAIAIALGATWYSHKHPKESLLSHTAYGLLAAGAIGNLIDRIWLTKVTDMFDFRAINFPIFNVADACITIATILLILVWWREAIKHGHAEKAEKATSVEPEPEA